MMKRRTRVPHFLVFQSWGFSVAVENDAHSAESVEHCHRRQGSSTDISHLAFHPKKVSSQLNAVV
jgi:hypothetical protein